MPFSTRHFLTATICAASLLAASCTNVRGAGAVADAGPPVRGGVLKIVGSSDVDHLATTSAYASSSIWFVHTFARQLVTYQPSFDWQTAIQLAPDLAETLPSLENGGITKDALVYTFHMRRGVFWNTAPPREVNALDSIRGMKLLCNPVSPTGAPGYYESTIAGMHDYCVAFARVPGTVADIKTFVETHNIAGVEAMDEFTVVFRLNQPTPDFLNLLAMPFASPVPAEYLNYLPDGPEFRQHTISNGPYQITKYTPNRSYRLERNPVWDPQTSPLQPAYVDAIDITLGIDQQLAQLQLEAGSSDISFTDGPPVSELAALLQIGDPGLSVTPSADEFVNLSYLVINFAASDNAYPLKKLKVREALAWAIDKQALTQNVGGPQVGSPARQAVMKGVSGFQPGEDSFVTKGDRGDPERAKALLAEAGYPNGISLNLAYAVLSEFPMHAQTLQSSLERAGIHVRLTPYTSGDFWSRVLTDPDNARRGIWDIALTGWFPDWYGPGNGRSVIEPLFDGRHYGRNSTDYGGYNSPEVNAFIDRATSALTSAEAQSAWAAATRKVMADVAIVPLISMKYPRYRSLRTKNCKLSVLGLDCDLTNVWLRGGHS